MPKLQVFLSDGNEVTHDLSDGEVTVGRVEDNTLQIEENSVSSHHALLSVDGENVVLKDIGSTNGTRLNGADLAPDTERKLKPGDKVRFGQIETILLSEAPSAAGSEARPLPEEEDAVAVPAASSTRPRDFANASPFQKKKKKKEPAAMAILAFGVLALLAFGAAVFFVLQMKSPL